MIVTRQFSPQQRMLAPAFVGVAVAVVLTIAVFPPSRAFILLVAAACAIVVLAEPKLAYVLLPISVPWGSVFTINVGSIAVTPSDVTVGALLAASCVRAVGRRELTPARNRWVVALVLLILAMAISTWDATSLTASAKELVKWIEVLVAVALAPTYLKSTRDVWAVVLATIFAASAEAALGLIQVALHSGPRSFATRGNLLRAFGTFGQPNPMAGYLNMILPIAIAFAWVRRSAPLALLSILIALGSVLTLSRSGWAAGLLAVVVVGAFYSSRLRSLIPIGVALGLIAVLLAALTIIPIGPFFRIASSFGLTQVNFSHYTHANFSEIERAAHWVAGLRMFAAHPFTGVGIGNYAVVYPSYHVGSFVNALGHAHNYFINIAAEAGILGLFAYTFFIVAALSYTTATALRFNEKGITRNDPGAERSRAVGQRSAWRRSKPAKLPLLYPLPARLLAGTLAVGVTGLWVSSTFHNLFDVLYVHEMPLLIGVLMGALIAADGMTTMVDRSDSSVEA